MAYQEEFVNRIREALTTILPVEEKAMFQGMCFMVDDKMCICTFDEEFLCRIGTVQAEIELEKGNCRQMVNGKTIMKDYVYVSAIDIRSNKDFNYWIGLCLAFNNEAKSSKKKPGTQKEKPGTQKKKPGPQKEKPGSQKEKSGSQK